MPAFIIGGAPSYGGCDWPSDANSGRPISIGDDVSGIDLVTGLQASGVVSAVTFVFDGSGMTSHAVVEDADGTRHDMGDAPVLVGPFAAIADAMGRPWRRHIQRAARRRGIDVYSDEVSDQTRYAGDGIVTCSRAMESMLTPEPTVCSVDRAATYWWVCAFKYVWRFPHKRGARDVRKAIDCLEEAPGKDRWGRIGWNSKISDFIVPEETTGDTIASAFRIPLPPCA